VRVAKFPLTGVAELELRNYIIIEGGSGANPPRYLGTVPVGHQVGTGKGFGPSPPSA